MSLAIFNSLREDFGVLHGSSKPLGLAFINSRFMRQKGNMEVKVHLDPETGRSVGVAVDGVVHAAPEITKAVVNPSKPALPLAARMVLTMVCGIRDFVIMFLIWSPKKGIKGQAYKTYTSAKLGKEPDGQEKDVKAEAEALAPRSLEPATNHATVETEGGTKVRLAFYSQQQKVARSVGVPLINGRGKPSMRFVPLGPLLASDFSPEFPFCVENAILRTKVDITRGLLSEVTRIGASRSRELGLVAKPTQDEPVVVADPDELPKSDYTKVATGQVVRMETVEKRFGDNPPYQTFEVAVLKLNGEEVCFNGKQLEEKAAAGQFKLGDVIAIGQSKVAVTKKGKRGKALVASSNAFQIKVVQASV